jgi:hypothetical protein
MLAKIKKPPLPSVGEGWGEGEIKSEYIMLIED